MMKRRTKVYFPPEWSRPPIMKQEIHGGTICPAYQCNKKVTHALVYGCLNQHIHDICGCEDHINEWVRGIPHYHCGQCKLNWQAEDIIVEKLCTAATPS